MNLALTFVSGVIYGQGCDTVGSFKITGSYDASNNECYWTKAYEGSHCVAYRGFYDNGAIWGIWAVSPAHHGGFQIWPVAEQRKLPAKRVVKLAIPARHTRFQRN